jgi:hypothetical protein
VSLLRRYHHRLRHHQRFHVAVLLTIVAVSYVAVPAVLRVVEAVGSYDPGGYDPKDFARGAWLARRGAATVGALAWDDLVKFGLFVLAGLAWLAVGPAGASPRRRLRR